MLTIAAVYRRAALIRAAVSSVASRLVCRGKRALRRHSPVREEAVSGNVGGAVNPGATVRGAVVRGIPGPDLGTWRSPSREVHRSRKHSMATTKQRR
jgi:hypothetical protein